MPPQRRLPQQSQARQLVKQQRSDLQTGFVSVGTLAGTVALNNVTLRVLRPTGGDLIIAALEVMFGGIIGANLIADPNFGCQQPATMVSLGLLSGGTAHLVGQTFAR